jgi:hypothetical protein
MEAVMASLPMLFAAAAMLAAFLGSIAVWSPRRLPAKVGALVVAGLFLPLAYAGLTDLMSRPKPVSMEWWLAHTREATVLAAVPEEGRRIFLWLALEGADEPRAYVMPWTREAAQQLQDAQEQAAEEGGEVRMQMPFERSLENRQRMFYAEPQPAPPAKPDEGGAVMRYEGAM